MDTTTQEKSILTVFDELRSLPERLDACISNAKFVTLNTEINPVDVDEFSRNAQANFQNYQDMMNRYNLINAKIIENRGKTVVTLAGRKYTVLQALERKKNLTMEKQLLYTMQIQWSKTTRILKEKQKAQQEFVDKDLIQEHGEKNKTSVDVIDPLGLEVRISEMEHEIAEFEDDVAFMIEYYGL